MTEGGRLFFRHLQIVGWNCHHLLNSFNTDIIILILQHIWILTGCDYPNYHGDGFCDDENNNEACFLDGGDCCGSNVDTIFCSECLCLEWWNRVKTQIRGLALRYLLWEHVHVHKYWLKLLHHRNKNQTFLFYFLSGMCMATVQTK